MSLKLESDVIFYYKRLLAQDVAKAEPILQETACMNPKERDIYGLLEVSKNWLEIKENISFEQLIKEVQRTFQILGQMRWQRGELTHLALKVGSPIKEGSYYKKGFKPKSSASSQGE